jgi:hypothetical protein
LLGDAAFGEIESAQENAGLSADRVGDDLFMGEFMIQRRTCDAPVDLEKLGRELDERLDRKPAMALVVMPIFMAIASAVRKPMPAMSRASRYGSSVIT